MNSILSADGTEHIVTDSVSERVVAVPVVLTNHLDPVGELRRFLTQCVFHPEAVAGVRIVKEGVMTPLDFRAAFPVHLWHANEEGASDTPERAAIITHMQGRKPSKAEERLLKKMGMLDAEQ